MTNVANWVSENTSTTGTGPVTLTGPVSSDLAGFQEAFGTGTLNLYYSIKSGNNREAGIGSYNGTTEILTRTTPLATLVGGVYDNTSPTPINLTGTSEVSCTFNASAFNDFIVGPSSVTDSRVVLFDGTTGKLLKESSFLDSDFIALPTDNQFGTALPKIQPDSDDRILVEDSAISYAKRYVPFSAFVDLTNAEFPSYAVFSTKVTATSAAVDFASGNKQEIDAATYPAITVDSPLNHPSNFILTILNSASLTSIQPAAGGAIGWEDGTAPAWAGKTVLALYYDGSVWSGSGMVNVS